MGGWYRKTLHLLILRTPFIFKEDGWSCRHFAFRMYLTEVYTNTVFFFFVVAYEMVDFCLCNIFSNHLKNIVFVFLLLISVLLHFFSFFLRFLCVVVLAQVFVYLFIKFKLMLTNTCKLIKNRLKRLILYQTFIQIQIHAGQIINTA